MKYKERLIQIVPALPGWKVAWTDDVSGYPFYSDIGLWGLVEDEDGFRNVVPMITFNSISMDIPDDFDYIISPSEKYDPVKKEVVWVY